MGVIMTVMMLWISGGSPAGVLLFWGVSSIFGIAQAMNFSPEVFFSWEHDMEGPKQLARILGEDARDLP